MSSFKDNSSEEKNYNNNNFNKKIQNCSFSIDKNELNKLINLDKYKIKRFSHFSNFNSVEIKLMKKVMKIVKLILVIFFKTD